MTPATKATLSLLVLFTAFAAPVANADDTINVPGPLSPRELAVPADADPDTVRLTDDTGRTIPLTGERTRSGAENLRVLPPKLAEGTYTISHREGSETFTVGDPTTSTPSSGDGPSPWLIAAPLLLLAAVLLATGRRRLGTLTLLAALAVPVTGALLPSDADTDAPDPCANIELWETRLRCMYDHVQDALDAGGVAHAVDRLEALASRPDGRWGVACHEIAHYLGQISWKETSDTRRLVEAGTLSCSFGYFHGLLESIGTYTSDETFPQTAADVCDRLGKRFAIAAEDGSVRECAHGIGHAAMWRHNENLTSARRVCTGLADETWQEECDSGAVMSWVFARESARVENRPQDAPEPAVAKPLDLCSPPLGSPTYGCVDGALSGTLRSEYDDSLEWCRTRPEQAATCASSLGRRLMAWEVENLVDAADEARRLCTVLHGEPAGRNECMTAVAWTHLHILRDYPRTQKFCAATGPEFAAGCRNGVLRFYETMLRRGDGSGGEIPADVLEELRRGN